MRILSVHADYIEVEPLTKALKFAESVEKKKKRYEEVLVVFTAVEKQDENVSAVAERLAVEADIICKQVKCKRILLYPLVHLTSAPSSPRTALEVIQKAEALLKKKGCDVDHAPFGWYKGYTLKCKGHPLSELSRELRAEGDIKIKEESETLSASLKQEAQLQSRFYVLDCEGKLHEVGDFQITKGSDFEKFVTYETKKIRAYEQEPPHIAIMKQHSLIDYEPGSDSGNFRFLPKGRLVKSLLEEAITDYCIGAGAMEVESPIMYDMEHPTLKKYLNRFPARQYTVLSDEKKLFLRFAACFGQFLIAHDMVFSYKQLPMKMFELTRYSFRREQSGELAGLKRLRAFTMPDMHTLTADIEQAKQEFEGQLDMSLEWNRMLSLDIETAFRAQEDFFSDNKDWYVSMVKKIGKPVFLELFAERYAYFITKFEFNFVDSMHKASALSTVQIDVENADTYDISYVGDRNEKKRPLILHASLSGSLERVIYALLEREAMKIAKGKKAMFPVWLSPSQVRIVPVSEKHKDHCIALLKNFNSRKVRAEVDDRDETLGKKIRDAEKEWIPYIVVVGDKESDSGMLAVSIRATGEKKEMKVSELVETVEHDCHNYPFRKLSLPQLLSKRPVI
jgi:threonyl-tRNA synthetase